MFLAVLRCADEHLDQVIVQAVENLPLQSPLELRIVKVAWMQIEIVGGPGLGRIAGANVSVVTPRGRLIAHALLRRATGTTP